MMKPAFKVLVPVLALGALGVAPVGATEKKPLQVFILAGQSNMEGHGFVAAEPQRNGGRGSLEFLLRDPATASRFAKYAKDIHIYGRGLSAVPNEWEPLMSTLENPLERNHKGPVGKV